MVTIHKKCLASGGHKETKIKDFKEEKNSKLSMVQ